MLAVPTKKGKSADWGAPLREYIAATYGEKTADEQTESLAKLNQAREWVLSNNRKTDEASLENAKTYLRMLGAVEARFPIKETHVNITFTWYDSFKPAKKFMHHRVEAEKAAVLFNYAAMESYAGMVQDRSTAEGNTAATNHFLTAARYFEYLKDVYIPNKVSGPVTSDLSNEGLSMLTALMLAQAQIALFEKAAKNKMKPTILSKLAAGVVELYRQALTVITAPNLESIIDVSWENHIQFQMKCFSASAAFQHAKVLFEKAEETGEGYGERIAFLQFANSKCDAALTAAKSGQVSSSMTAPIESLQTSIMKELNKAISDNNAIYMDPIPTEASLTPPAAKVLASVDLSKVDSSLVDPILPGMDLGEELPGVGLFKEMLPAEVQIAVALFNSTISDLTDRATKAVTENEAHVKDSLAGANLPAAMEAGGGKRGLPDATWSKILEKVHEKGGVNGLKSTLLGNKKLADQLTAILYDSQQKLKVDEAADLKNRQVWGAKWTLPPAAEANSFIKKDCARFQGYLMEAKESDRLLSQKIDTEPLKKLLADVSMPKESLDLLMPDPGDVDDDTKVESLRSNLRMSYIKLQTHLQDVKKRLEDFKYETNKLNIVQELYKKNSNVSDLVADEAKLKSIIEEKIKPFEEGQFNELQHMAEQDTMLLSRVLSDNSAYLAARLENSATKEREQAIARLDRAIEEYEGLNKNIDDGKKFYANLSEKVSRLQTLVNDHCLSRDLLAKEMEQNLHQGLDTNTFNSPLPQVQPPVTTAYTGMQYNNPSQMAPVMVTAVPNPSQPVVTQVVSQPVNTGMSLMEQMRKAQEEAERNGTLNTMVGGDITEPARGPTNTPEDDAKAAQTAMALQQQEILDAINLQKALAQTKNPEYTKELAQVKDLLGNTYPDDLVLGHLKATQGNVAVAVSNLMDGVPLKAEKEKKKGGGGGFGFFGRKKKDKPANNGGNTQNKPQQPPNNGGAGGNFTW